MINAKAKDVADKLWNETQAVCDKLDPVKDKLLIASIKGFVRTSNSAAGVAHMITLAQSEPGVVITYDLLDKNEMLLNVINGTIDLTTGELRPHDRADLITKQCPVEFDPAAECPQWEQFLSDIMVGNRCLIGYLQRLVGYCLTGNTREHILPFLHGEGGNGKGVFTSVIMALLGCDYSMRSAPELLMAKGNESHPTERADLFGKRLVISNEIEAGKRLNEALVKDLTGGDAIRARRMREDFWQFLPTHKVWMVGNHKPEIRGTDNGIWRRLRLIPFNRIFRPCEQNKTLSESLLLELPGIHNWGIAGCLEWQAEGLGEPAAVLDATAEYREEQDVVAGFIEACCTSGETAQVKAMHLYACYKRWADFVGECPMTLNVFGAEMGKRYQRFTSNGTWYRGIALRPDRPSHATGTNATVNHAAGNCPAGRTA